MTFKSFKSVLSALLLCGASGSAQTSLPPTAGTQIEQGAAEKKDDKKTKEGFLRFWNMLPPTAGELQVVHDTGASEPTVLISAEPANLFATYRGLKPGRYLLKLVRPDDPKTTLKTFDVIFRTDVYVTIFAHDSDGKQVFELIDDTYDAEQTLSGRVTFRQCTPDTTVIVKILGHPDFGPLSPGEERRMEDLPLKPVTFQMQARVSGKLQTWPLEIDFRRSRRASIWLIKDDFGRFRPRVSLDGAVQDIAAAK